MSKPEQYMMKLLNEANISFEREKTFSDLNRGRYRYDFYCPNVNGKPLLIEVDGAYHRKPIRGQFQLLKQKEHDRRKNNYCLAKEIKLIRVPDFELFKKKSFKEILDEEKYVVRSMWHSD